MPRQSKESVGCNCRIEKEVDYMLKDFLKKTGLSKTVTVERALRAYISEYNKTGKV